MTGNPNEFYSLEEKEAMSDELQDSEPVGVDHSPLPWTFTYFTKPDGSEIKTPQDVADTVAHSALACEGTTLWGVTLDEPDEQGRTVVICYTGNGPHSEANARLIVAAINALNITQEPKENTTMELNGTPDTYIAGMMDAARIVRERKGKYTLEQTANYLEALCTSNGNDPVSLGPQTGDAYRGLGTH